MKSPCLQCATPVAHLVHERPFCSVACNADFAIERSAPSTPAAPVGYTPPVVGQCYPDCKICRAVAASAKPGKSTKDP